MPLSVPSDSEKMAAMALCTLEGSSVLLLLVMAGAWGRDGEGSSRETTQLDQHCPDLSPQHSRSGCLVVDVRAQGVYQYLAFESGRDGRKRAFVSLR